MTTVLGPIFLKDEEATSAFANAVGAITLSGDTFLLEGDIGAGKSFFSRNLIQSLLTEPEDIPSPTFTLVQTYSAPNFEIWHCDLYRLNGVDDILELGLDEAFETDVCLIEWPDRLGSEAPKDAATLVFKTISEKERSVSLKYSHPKWAKLGTVLHDFS